MILLFSNLDANAHENIHSDPELPWIVRDLNKYLAKLPAYQPPSGVQGQKEKAWALGTGMHTHGHRDRKWGMESASHLGVNSRWVHGWVHYPPPPPDPSKALQYACPPSFLILRPVHAHQKVREYGCIWVVGPVACAHTPPP